MSEEVKTPADPEKVAPTEPTALEDPETQHVEEVHSPTFDNDLQKEKTLAHVDIENKQAFKGDDSDGKMGWGWRSIVSAIFLAMLYTGSQILVYFVGGALSFIEDGLHSTASGGWMPTAYTLGLAAVAPFVGYMQDLFGKRYIALIGALFLCIGCVLLATASTFRQALVAMSFAGAGAGIGELTGLAGMSESVPVKYRGYSLAIVTAFVFPFTPYVMYAQLLSTYHTWRWGAWISFIYNAVTAIGLLLTYFPIAHPRAEGFTAKAIAKRIDYIGAFLSIVGLTLFLVALQAGGYTHSWKSAYVLATLLIGIALIFAWFIWEFQFAKHPMIPRELFQGQRVVALAYVVAFVAGMNFFSVLNFWPLLIEEVYNSNPVYVGLRGLAPGLTVTIGAIVFNSLLSYFPGASRWILFTAATILTAFGGALSVLTPDNEITTIAVGTVGGIGLGGLIVPAATVAMIAAPDALITTCAALSLSVRAVGGGIGYSIYFNIFINKITKLAPNYVALYTLEAGLPGTLAEEFITEWLTGSPEQAAKIPGITPKVVAAAIKGTQWAYAKSLRYVWLATIPFGVLAMVCALLIPNTRRFQTNRIAVKL